MKKITIINAYGNKNIGDGAIQESALNFLDKLVDKKDTISLLSVDNHGYKKNSRFNAQITQHQLPYGYAIKSSSKPLSHINKIYRFAKIITASLCYTLLAKINRRYLSKETPYSYIRAIIEADIVIGMGGGYLTSRYGITDNFGLLLTLLPIYIAKQHHKKIIFLPLTFGPFANATHTKMTHKILANTTVFCRDKNSLQRIEKLNNKKYSVKTVYTPDLALFLDSPVRNKLHHGDNYYVITAREWLEKKEQKYYEKELRKTIQKNWNEKKLKAIFIPMAYNAIEDDDRRVANRINKKLHNKKIFTIANPSGSREVQKILQSAQFAICTRMHSAILSFITETPFITIAYSPKTNHFLKDFGLSEWNINIEKFDAILLDHKINKLTKKENYDDFIDLIKIHKSRLTEQKKEFQIMLHAFIN
jgi:polysaccharide pyruvyl transferase WcaK-like protein